VDKNLLNRLEELERRVDIGDVRTASTEALMAYLAGVIGRVPTLDDLKRLAVGEAVEGPMP
jgi:hypothetical protein